MEYLFCCEFYYPSVGGVQEVMRQISERLVQRGHKVTVATTKLAERTTNQHNGVSIVEFELAGNSARGIQGDVAQYQKFVKDFQGDAILIKAAQQWTFDALWPVLDDIRTRKVFIPCGFSGLHEPSYKQYFCELPQILRKFDHLVFYATKYRDIDFARQHNIMNFSIIPNGASETEFSTPKDPEFRRRHGIRGDSKILLTVGSLSGVKGHRELLEAFVRLDEKCGHVTLILNGNRMSKPATTTDLHEKHGKGHAGEKRNLKKEILRRHATALSNRAREAYAILRKNGLPPLWTRILAGFGRRTQGGIFFRFLPSNIRATVDPMGYWLAAAQRPSSAKQLILCDLPRSELIQAYLTADLFVFCSNIEYSPLVLFEAAAAGTPFLSVPVGNAEEIAAWTKCGIICPAPIDERGYTRVVPQVLAEQIFAALSRPEYLANLGWQGRANWRQRFTWDAIAAQYEAVLCGQSIDSLIPRDVNKAFATPSSDP